MRIAARRMAMVTVLAGVGVAAGLAPATAGSWPHARGVVPRQAASPASGPGAVVWARRYNGPGNGYDDALATAVSPGGRRVFVTGFSEGAPRHFADTTIAYRAGTGTQVWVRRYTDTGDAALAVSPGGRRVYVTGGATAALDAATGARLWARPTDGVGVAVSPTGRTVFVLGQAGGPAMPTLALDAATGKQLWKSLYTPPGGCNVAESIVADPSGGAVFVTGICPGPATEGDYATVAYNAATGAQLWASRYNGPGNGQDYPSALAVSPDGGTVFVTGASQNADQEYQSATIAYNAATGARLWASRYHVAGSNYDAGSTLAVSPSGSTVFVTGISAPDHNGCCGYGYSTVAYNTATGTRQWARFYSANATDADVPRSVTIALSPSGQTVYIAGNTSFKGKTEYLTVGYNAGTGAQEWIQRYDGPDHRASTASAIAVSPATGTVFVTGSSYGRSSGLDYATLAYHG